jgi:hypothetical protein
MTPDKRNPASAAARTGSGDIDCWATIGTSDKPNARKYQELVLARRFLLWPDRARVLAFHGGGAP